MHVVVDANDTGIGSLYNDINWNDDDNESEAQRA